MSSLPSLPPAGATPAVAPWQTVGLRAAALAALLQPLRPPRGWTRPALGMGLAWVLHLHLQILLLSLALLGASPGAAAHGTRAGSLHIAHPHAPPTPAGLSVAAVYIKALHNRGTADERLIGASSPLAAAVEIHRMTLDAGRMQMRAVDALDLPAGQSLRLQPGAPGQHLMLIGLRRPLRLGERLPLILHFERAGAVATEVWVETATPDSGPRARSAGDPPAGPDGHAAHDSHAGHAAHGDPVAPAAPAPSAPPAAARP